jgi:pSer/pThr/pTyr-binding forkhead associated (FHA) protein
MANAKLTILSPGQPEREVELSGGVTIGRAADNSICLDSESVGRYHAIIEQRADGFWLSDLGSSNGTTVNGAAIVSERKLQHGDTISIGGASIKFYANGARSQSDQASRQAYHQTTGQTSNQSSSQRFETSHSTSGLSPKYIAVAVVAGLLVTGMVGLLAYSLLSNRKGDCGSVRISSPSSGAVLNGPVAISLAADKPDCFRRAVYKLNGEEFDSSASLSSEVIFDPAKLKAQFPQLSSGAHKLSVVVEDQNGQLKELSSSVQLTFEVASPRDGISLDVIRSLAQSLAGQISGRSGSSYVFEPQFLEQIRSLTQEYRADVMADAEKYRSEINRAFHNNMGLPQSLGFVLAMSRSRFREDAAVAACGVDPSGVGLWRVPRLMFNPAEYEGAQRDSKRAAEMAAKYLKDLLNAFDGPDDFMYAVACYGEPISRAGEIVERVPDAAARRNFWKMVESGLISRQEASRAACFFAAGIVGENPQVFNLNAKPLSTLY